MDSKPPEKIEHLLVLKVMKLIKPTLSSPLIVTNESKDLPENILNNDLKQDITSVEGSETLAVGQFLMIPQSLGNIYLGESFSSYIFVHNCSNHIAKNVRVKANLETSTQKIFLFETNRSELSRENTIDEVIYHEVKEIGTHLLKCEVTYVSPSGEPLSFTKCFQFEVFKPLDVKTKVYNAESDEVFIEAEVQNITTSPINLEKVSFESCQMFKVTSLNDSEGNRPGEGLLQPEASRQYLYCLTPVHNPDGHNVLGAINVGHLDISWCSALGERGRLLTTQLQSMAPDFGDIRFSVQNLPNIVKIEEPFTFTCKISNLSKRCMDLILNLEKLYPDLLWIGASGTHLGRLEIASSKTLNLTLVPLSAGLHNISGIRLKDSFLNKTYEYDDVAQIFVT